MSLTILVEEECEIMESIPKRSGVFSGNVTRPLHTGGETGDIRSLAHGDLSPRDEFEATSTSSESDVGVDGRGLQKAD